MKRLFDCLVSIITLLMLIPIMLLVALIIVIDDRGTPFFKQNRVGKDGRVFGMYKFRSMKLNSRELGPYFTQENDPRITRIGKIIRRTSIDELPQLINVICGDMSLVGPRPDVPIQESNYKAKDWALRTSVKPGITGLAQATVRSSAVEGERLKLDLEYIERKSFMFDMKIILMTVEQIIKKGGN